MADECGKENGARVTRICGRQTDVQCNVVVVCRVQEHASSSESTGISLELLWRRSTSGDNKN